jgi:hypothetical protein
MDDIKQAQYDNLRKCVNENLTEPILGKRYYNMGLDVYSADEETTKDLKNQFDELKFNIKNYRLLLIVSIALNTYFILTKIF